MECRVEAVATVVGRPDCQPVRDGSGFGWKSLDRRHASVIDQGGVALELTRALLIGEVLGYT